MNSTHTEKPKKQKPASTSWLDDIRINRTVRAWRRDQKKEARRNRFAAATWISPHACNPEVVVLFKAATAQVEGMSTDLIATQQLRLRRFEPLELRLPQSRERP